jgi:Predicted Zn-dependent peptidases
MKLFIVSLALIFTGLTIQAQTPAPVDPSWRIGTLSNGMKYYIRSNPKPEGKASFWIAHDIGALHETHNQNGLAHFLEHMAFNGLKHFPGKSMLEYMQSIGCSFGGNINASTSQTLTQYLLTNVPISREGIIDTCLLILHDWSGHILCEPDELDAERGVIREEWRTGNSAPRRSMNERNKTFFAGTPYATRSVIGDTSIINNFTQKDILDFYDDWYRPNLQAVVIVGDFDANMMENKVKALFSTLTNPENIKEKVEFNIPDNIEPIIKVYKDPELTSSSAMLYVKFPRIFDKTNRNTEEYVRYGLARGYISSMLSARFREAQQQPEAKFLSASSGFTSFAGDRDAFVFMVSAKNNELQAGFEEVLALVEQARRFGFTPSELERAKANTLRSVESSFTNRNDRNSTEYNSSAYSNFQNGSPIMSEEQNLNLTKKFNPGIQVEELNNLLKNVIVYGPNTLIFASGPDKEDVIMPIDETLGIAMYGASKKEVLPYEDVAIDKPLIAKAIKAGKVSKESKNTALDAVEWTLSNGIKVILKPTQFRQDEISFSGFSFGGTSLLSDTDWAATRSMMSVVNSSGVGEFSTTALNKKLTGIRASVMPSLSELAQNISGSCSPKDFETMLQLTYLYFTQPRFDQNDYDIAMGRIRNSLKNQSAEPAYTLNDTLNIYMNNFHLRGKPLKEEDLDKMSMSKMQEVYKQRFANPGAFTFIFVGNIDLATTKPLIEKYLGGLAGNKKETWKDLGRYPVKGEVKNHFERKMEVDKASVYVIHSGELANTLENSMAMNYLARILRIRYIEEIREKRGGTYGASASGGFSTIPKERYQLIVSFDTDPKMKDELIEVVYDEIKKIADNGPLEEDFQKTQENLKSQFDQNQKENGYWSSVLNSYYYYGKDTHNTWQETFSKTDRKAIQNFAKEILKQKNIVEIVMVPESK